MIKSAQQQHFDRCQNLTNEIGRCSRSDQSEVSTLVGGFYLTCRVADVQSCQKLLFWKYLFTFRSYESVDIRRQCNSLRGYSFFYLTEGEEYCIPSFY